MSDAKEVTISSYSLEIIFGCNALLFASTFLDSSATISLGTIGVLYNHSAPSTTNVSPLTYPPLASHAKYTAAIPISNAVPSLPIGIPSVVISFISSAVKPGASLAVPGVFSIGPGATIYQTIQFKLSDRLEENVKREMTYDTNHIITYDLLPFTLILSHPHSNAKLLVNESIALLAADACA